MHVKYLIDPNSNYISYSVSELNKYIICVLSCQSSNKYYIFQELYFL